MSKRMLQINQNLQRELSPIIAERYSWDNALVTITYVMVSPDLKNATAWVSVIPVTESEKVIKLLNSRSFELYNILADRLIMKHIPRIEFKFDEATDKLNKIDQLLSEAS